MSYLRSSKKRNVRTQTRERKLNTLEDYLQFYRNKTWTSKWPIVKSVYGAHKLTRSSTWYVKIELHKQCSSKKNNKRTR